MKTGNYYKNKKPTGKFSSIIKGIQSRITSSKIQDLGVLGGDAEMIKKTIEDEVIIEGYIINSNEYKRECVRRIGIFSEYASSLGFVLKVPHLTNKYGSNFQLNEWDKKNKIPKKVKSILDISGGSSTGGEIDILIIDEIIHKIWCFSSKFRKMYDGNIHWGDTEVDRMPVIESRNNKCFDAFNKSDSWNYGTFIYDRKHIVNICKKYKDIIIHDFQDIKIIWKEVYDILSKNQFDCDKIDKIVNSNRIHLEPKFHQIIASKKAIEYWNKKIGKFFLFDHISRSGKTITGLYTIKQMGFKNVLLLTSYPCVNEREWGATIRKFYDFEYWNVVNFSGKKGQFDPSKSNFVMISLQDLKSNDKDNLNYGWNKPKFDKIRNQHWDCIIVDEVHYGYETDKSKSIIDGLDFDYCLALSATPFINYFKNTFDSSNTHRWTMNDEKERAKIDPIYAEYPKMHFLLFSPPPNIYSEYQSEYSKEDGLTFRKILRLKDDGTFFYQKDVEILLKYLFGEKDTKYNSRNTPLGWARDSGIDKIEGILIFVPECCHLKPLQQLLLKNNIVKKRFGKNIYYTDSDLNKSGELDVWLQKKAVVPFIIIAVGQLTTGVTVAEIDTVILMDDGKSPQQLIQRMFRCRTAMKGKKDVFVIDMNPGRSINMIFEYTSQLAEIDKTDQKECFKEWFSLTSTVYCKDNKFIDCEKDIDRIYQEASSKYYNYFGKTSLIKDIPESAIELLSKIKFNDGESIKKKEKYSNGIDKGKNFKRKFNKNIENKSDDEENEQPENEKQTKQKIMEILNSMPWASVLSGCQSNRYDNIFKYLDKNLDLKKEYDKLLFDKDNTMSGQQINSLLKDCIDEKPLNSIIENFNMNIKAKPRETNKMLILNEKFKKLFGEVFTPIPLVEEMLDKLPKEIWIDKNIKWLDPSCGTCNFLLIIKQRLMESLKEIIKDDNEREKWILEKMIYGVDIQERNIILSKLRLDPYNKFKLNIEAHDSLLFDFWGLKFEIIIGNPPYGKNANLAVKFLNKASILSKNIYFVLPKSLRKPSIINRLHSSLHCILDFDVPIQTFENGISTCIQKYIIKDIDRLIIPTRTTHKDFDFVDKNDANLCLGRVGGGPCGKVYESNFKNRSKNSHYFLKVVDNKVIERLKSLEKPFREIGLQTVGCPSLSKNDLINIYEKHFGEDNGK